MKNFRRLALVAGVAALSAVAFSPKAQAQDSNVDFTANVPATCAINSVTNGTLARVSDGQYVADGYSPANTNGTGTAGIINVTCNAGTKFTVTSVTDNGGSINFSTTATSTSASKGVTIRDAATGTEVSATTVGSAGSAITAPITAKNYAVQLNLFKGGGQPLPVGTYNVRAVITLSPQ
jgi:hypothetical protein